ncbi:PLP-dependent aminotransferase family protein [Rhodovarius crocodyli]|uniref:PLP-dependent aminotransferase family protein n=1 Tax=Rhodovarius crocodyli TaxID=1979269 RepID=A0A437M2T1_9PROT|nr:PLP-dependent aminotransferase family protein [Rhodovarius crocodyli]RVT92011.1 PLP-dependent aminotransferase family protein [Rhodovarius crocodyli]
MAAEDTLTRRICEAIKAQIARGSLQAGERVPSSRSLALEWGVSRTTVTAAYEQLLAEGYLIGRPGARARVAEGLGRLAAASEPRRTAAPVMLSAYGRRVSGFPAPLRHDARLVADFRYGDLSADDFPLPAWRKAVGAALLRRRPRLRYGDPAGSEALRHALQGYLWRARGLRCDASQIIIVNGSQQGLDLCARLLLDPDDRAVMEEPGYQQARQAFLAAGAALHPAPVDREGMATEGLPPARLAYATPSHQFPLGCVMSAARRRELLAWAARHGAHVIEDDYDSEYRYDIAPVPPLRALDDGERVIYLGTVSKTLSPTLRLGYLVVPPALAHAFVQAKRLTDRHAPLLEQEALAALIESGAYERHVQRARRRNGERRAALLEALAGLGAQVTVAGADAGLHVVAWLNDVPAEREAAFTGHARSMGLGLYPIAPLHAGGTGAGLAGLVLGYAGLDVGAIGQGVALLGDCLAGFR